MADSGYGTTIAFATSGFAGEIIDVPTFDYFERIAIATSHMNMGTGPKGKTFIPADLYDPGTLTITVNFESGEPGMVTTVAAETISITFPDSDGKKFQCSGFCLRASVPIPMEDRMVQTLEIKFTGDWNFDAA